MHIEFHRNVRNSKRAENIETFYMADLPSSQGLPNSSGLSAHSVTDFNKCSFVKSNSFNQDKANSSDLKIDLANKYNKNIFLDVCQALLDYIK